VAITVLIELINGRIIFEMDLKETRLEDVKRAARAQNMVQ
jgi:hypothetical protein